MAAPNYYAQREHPVRQHVEPRHPDICRGERRDGNGSGERRDGGVRGAVLPRRERVAERGVGRFGHDADVERDRVVRRVPRHGNVGHDAGDD